MKGDWEIPIPFQILIKKEIKGTMANTTKTPTKAQIEAELNETKTALQDTQNALKESMDLIKELKEQLNQQPQVVVQSDKRVNAKIKCINLAHNPVNIATMPNGQGRVYTFNEYGQVHYIRHDDLLDIISSYPKTMESGIIYVADKEFCDEQNLYENEQVVYTKDIMDKLVYLREDVDVDMLCGMSAPLLESTVREIAKLYNNNEAMEPNKLERIKQETGYDIVKLAEDIKIMSADEIKALED